MSKMYSAREAADMERRLSKSTIRQGLDGLRRAVAQAATEDGEAMTVEDLRRFFERIAEEEEAESFTIAEILDIIAQASQPRPRPAKSWKPKARPKRVLGLWVKD